MDTTFYIGPAGWSYPDWTGIVYPPEVVRRRGRLAFIAGVFDLVEINSTFYRIPAPRLIETWLRTVEPFPAFRFNVKLFQGFTHARDLDPGRLAECRRGLELFRDGGRLGCVLVQFPWSFRCDRAEKIHLQRLLDALEGLPVAVEVRHRSWDTPAYYDYLAGRGVAVCNIDQPVIGRSLGLDSRVTAPFACLRLHGRNRDAWFREGAGRDERYNYLYSEAEIDALVAAARRLASTAGTVYVVTNNHYRGKAVFNALQLGRRLIPDFHATLTLSADDVR